VAKTYSINDSEKTAAEASVITISPSCYVDKLLNAGSVSYLIEGQQVTYLSVIVTIKTKLLSNNSLRQHYLCYIACEVLLKVQRLVYGSDYYRKIIHRE